MYSEKNYKLLVKNSDLLTLLMEVLDSDKRPKDLSIDRFKCAFMIEKNKILKSIVSYIFFEDKIKFVLLIKSKMDEHPWLNLLVKEFVKNLSFVVTNFERFYYSCFKLFGIYFENIKNNFGQFFEVVKNLKIKLNPFNCLVNFLIFCNGLNNYSPFDKEFSEDKKMKKCQDNYKLIMRENLSGILLNYCRLYDFNDFNDFNDDNEDKKDLEKTVQEDLKEFNCFNEICNPGEKYFQKFYKSLYDTIGKNLKDVHLQNSSKVNDFIDDLFQIIIQYFKFEGYWKNGEMLDMYEKISQAAYQYSTSFDFNENYLDFVINYKYKFNLNLQEFVILLVAGLRNEQLPEIFKLEKFDKLNNIDDKNEMKSCIKKLQEKKKKENKKNLSIEITNNYNQQKENLKKPNDPEGEDKKNLNEIDSKNNQKYNFVFDETKNTQSHTNINNIEIKENNEKKEKNNEEGKDIKNGDIKINNENIDKKSIDKKKQTNIDDNNNNNTEIKNLKKEMNKKIGKLNKKVLGLSTQVIEMSKKLKIISYRDLSKRLLNNMIKYVNNKNSQFLEGTDKKKDKVLKIINEYRFGEYEYMRNPLREINDKYSSSNTISHTPKIIQKYREQPFGLEEEPVENVAKIYYEIMIESKGENVYSFLKEKLNLEEEIKNLYF